MLRNLWRWQSPRKTLPSQMSPHCCLVRSRGGVPLGWKADDLAYIRPSATAAADLDYFVEPRVERTQEYILRWWAGVPGDCAPAV